MGSLRPGVAVRRGHTALTRPLVVPAEPEAGWRERAAEVLATGGILVYPTETLYAVGGRALDARAARRAVLSKGRPEGKPLPVIAADVEQARSLCASWPAVAAALAEAFWPGPLTLVLPASPEVPAEVRAGGLTVAVRVSPAVVARALARAAGPLVATSANRAGEPPGRTCAEAVAAVGAAVSLAIDAGPSPSAVPSTVVDLTSAEPRVLRAGAVAESALRAALGVGPARDVG